MPENILYIIERDYNPNDRSVLTTIERLQKQGAIRILSRGTLRHKTLDHHFFIPKPLEKFAKNLQKSNHSVLKVINWFFTRSFQHQYSPWIYLRILYEVNKFKPSVLYLREPLYLHSAIKIKKQQKTIRFHLDIRENPDVNFPNQAKVLRQSTSSLDYLQTVSEPMRNLLINDFGVSKEIVQVRPTLPSPSFLPEQFNLNTYKQSKPIKLCFFGDIKKDRYIHLCTDALKEINSTHDFELDIYGNVVHPDYLESLISNSNGSIRYGGLLPYNEASTVIRSYDIGILTNEINMNSTYTLPGKLWEYLCCGLAIMTNDRPSLKTYFVQNDIGWYLGSHKEWLKCFQDISHGNENLPSKKKNSIQLFKQQYDLNENC